MLRLLTFFLRLISELIILMIFACIEKLLKNVLRFQLINNYGFYGNPHINIPYYQLLLGYPSCWQTGQTSQLCHNWSLLFLILPHPSFICLENCSLITYNERKSDLSMILFHVKMENLMLRRTGEADNNYKDWIQPVLASIL